MYFFKFYLSVIIHLEAMKRCISKCNKSSYTPDNRNICKQALSCSNSCKMRQMGSSKMACNERCKKKNISGCGLKRNKHTFKFRGTANRDSCQSNYTMVEECQIGCSAYEARENWKHNNWEPKRGEDKDDGRKSECFHLIFLDFYTWFYRTFYKTL